MIRKLSNTVLAVIYMAFIILPVFIAFNAGTSAPDGWWECKLLSAIVLQSFITMILIELKRY